MRIALVGHGPAEHCRCLTSVKSGVTNSTASSSKAETSVSKVFLKHSSKFVRVLHHGLSTKLVVSGPLSSTQK